MKNLFSCILALAIISLAQADYRGRVFVDSNDNKQFDQSEQPLANVMVSDGLNVVKTGKDGTYSLPGHERARFIFITTPSGYKTDNRHFLKIRGKEYPYDFGVQPSEGIHHDGSHHFIHITDTEIHNTDNHQDWLDGLKQYILHRKPAFLIHTGDICYANGLKKHIKLMNTGNMGCPVFYTIGNHDLVDGEYGEELFESIYGPVWFSFDVGNVHYVVTPMLHGDRKPGYSKADVYHWLKNDLAHVSADTPVIVFNHDLLTSGREFKYSIGSDREINLNKHNLKAWIYGHWHINYMRRQGDVLSICTGTIDKGGIDHSTNAFRVLKVDRNGDCQSQLRYAYTDKHTQIAAIASKLAPPREKDSISLTVNAYSSGTPVTKISGTCILGQSEPLPPILLKQSTDWSWTASVPVGEIPAGTEVRIMVKTVFSDGTSLMTETAFPKPDRQPQILLNGEWANLGGNPAHTGIADAVVSAPLELAWANNLGANIFMSSPLVHKGIIYVATVDENLEGLAAMHALDGQTGQIIWKHQARNSIKNTIAIDRDCVFAQDAEGWLYAIDCANGQLKWEKKLPVKGLPALVDGLVASNGIVYAGAGKGLCAFDALTGQVKWQNRDWEQKEGTTSTLALSGNVLIGSAQWGSLHASDTSTGKLLWSIDSHGLNHRASSGSIHNGQLYIISEKTFFEIDTASGQIIRKKDLPFKADATSSPLVTDKAIIFGTSTSGLLALDRKTLDQKWHFQTGPALIYTAPYTRHPVATIETSPVLSGDTIYFGASDGCLYGLDCETGKPVWKHAVGAPVFSSPAISGNTLIIADFGGNVYAFTAKRP